VVVGLIANSLGLTPATAADLDPTGAYMQGMVGQGTASPKIQIWGNEDNPVLWRLAGTFAGESDQWGVDLVNRIAGYYDTAADIEFTTSWLPGFIFLHGYYNHRGHQWQAGATWLRDTSNPAWQALIGSGYTTQQTVQYQVYDYSCGSVAQLCDPQDTSCSDDACLSWVPMQINVYVTDPSDGVVPGRSARNDGGAWRGYIIEAPHVNHMEMLKYDQIDPTFRPIFDGNNTGNQSVFKIAE
jgi:hypothetical protein